MLPVMHSFRDVDYPVEMRIIVSELEGISGVKLHSRFPPDGGVLLQPATRRYRDIFL